MEAICLLLLKNTLIGFDKVDKLIGLLEFDLLLFKVLMLNRRRGFVNVELASLFLLWLIDAKVQPFGDLLFTNDLDDWFVVFLMIDVWLLLLSESDNFKLEINFFLAFVVVCLGDDWNECVCVKVGGLLSILNDFLLFDEAEEVVVIEEETIVDELFKLFLLINKLFEPTVNSFNFFRSSSQIIHEICPVDDFDVCGVHRIDLNKLIA